MNPQTIKAFLLSEKVFPYFLLGIVVIISLIAMRFVVNGVNTNRKWIERIGIAIFYILFFSVIVVTVLYVCTIDIETLKGIMV